MSARKATECEFSAGGVVVRGDQVVVVVPHRRSPDGRHVLALPKGHPEPGESMVQTARREVREEAGVDGELVDKLGDVRYWYQRDDRRIFKVVSFYLFRYAGGDIADHDHEIEDARWIALRDATTELTFKGEREMAERALSKLSGDR